MNASLRHPKAQGWSKLPYGPVFHSCLLRVLLGLVDWFSTRLMVPWMGNEHPAAAHSCDSQVIEDIRGIIPIHHSISVALPETCNDLSAAKTSNRNHHSYTSLVFQAIYLYDFCRFFLAPLPRGCLGSLVLVSFTSMDLS